MMRVRLLLALLTALCTTPLPTLAAHLCTAKVTTASDAAAKADWIIEGNVGLVARFASDGLSVTLDDARVIKGKGANRGGSDSVGIDPAFPGAATQFDGDAGRSIHGKRVRLFGTRHAAGAQRRAFFMQAAADPLPALPAPRALAVTRLFNDAVAEPAGNAWRHAHSTEGRYTVDIPAPFQDLTAVMEEKTGYMVRGTDAAGRTFMAIREPASVNAAMAGTFDTEMARASAKTRTFQGTAALQGGTANGTNVAESLMFRVPGSTWMLAVQTPRALEQKDPGGEAAMRERFYQSLVCD